MYRTCSITVKEEYGSSVRWYKLATFDFPHVLLSGGRVWLDVPNALLYDDITHWFQEVECDWTFLTPCFTTALITYCFQEVECDSTFLTYYLTSVERDSTYFTSCLKTFGRDSTFLTLCLKTIESNPGIPHALPCIWWACLSFHRSLSYDSSGSPTAWLLLCNFLSNLVITYIYLFT